MNRLPKDAIAWRDCGGTTRQAIAYPELHTYDNHQITYYGKAIAWQDSEGRTHYGKAIAPNGRVYYSNQIIKWPFAPMTFYISVTQRGADLCIDDLADLNIAIDTYNIQPCKHQSFTPPALPLS